VLPGRGLGIDEVMTNPRVVQVVRVAMIFAILLAVAGAVLAAVGGQWAAVVPAAAAVPVCGVVLMLTYQQGAGSRSAPRR
jgi:CHASE2 domain-containing sensor protein